MCGINGVMPPSREIIEAMNTKLYHRGPDATNTYLDESVALGHVLLSIRSSFVSSAVQPYHSKDQNWVMIFNGEIYNTQSLCETHGFGKVDLDTEVIMRLIEKKGWDFVSEIQGMFAIALYNKREKKIKLFRDVTGQKVIYYLVQAGRFYFSSEIKALDSILENRKVCEEGVEMGLTLGYIPAPYTMFRDIKKMRPGEILEWRPDDKTLTRGMIKPILEKQSASPEDFLSQQINLHALGKEKVAINLSGGLDSSIVFYEMVKSGITCDAYTTVFETARPEIYNEESEIAKKMATDFGMKHHMVHISKEKYFSNFLEAFETVEEPNHNIGLPHYLALAKEQGIRGNGVRVLLSGDGGDEIFSGYDYYHENATIIEQTTWLKKRLKSLALNIKNKNDLDYYDAHDRWIHVKAFRNEFNKVNSQHSYSNIRRCVDGLADYYPKKISSMYNLMLMDRSLWLPNENFIRTDKIFMSQSIEVRSPFSYYPLRCFFDQLLQDKDYSDGKTHKLFLRKIYQEKLPDYVVNRSRKWGWKPPWEEWFDDQARLFLADLFSGLSDDGMVKWSVVKNYILQSKKWPGREFWSYVSLAVLCKKYRIEI